MFKKIKSLLMILLLATWPAMQAQKNQKPNTTIDALLCANDTFRIGDKEFTTPETDCSDKMFGLIDEAV